MTRRELLALPAAGAVLRMPAISQTPYPGTAYRDYPRCLPDYIRGLAEQAYKMRNGEIARLTTPEAIQARQRWARETFWKLAGGEPERTPLDAQKIGSFERDGYRVERIVYQSRPRFHVPANLYIPTAGVPPYPAVLFQLGHSRNGKAYLSYQSCCQGLARLGYVVLAFDPMGQGERVYYPDAGGVNSRLPSPDHEHTVPGKQMLLVGDTSVRLQVWDAIRSLDYLVSLAMVDTKRIGTTGQSGGGTLSMLLMAADDRLAAAVVCSGNTENVACANFIPPGSTDDAEQDFVGSGPLGFDRWDTMYPFAPKPLLITVSDKDFFGTYSPEYIRSGWEEFQKLQKVYEVLGHGDRLRWADTPLPHSLEYDTRLEVYNWFERWLKGGEKRIEQEPPVTPEEDRTLWVAESGNVVRTFGGLTPFAMNKQRVVGKAAADLAALVGVDVPTGALAAALRRVPSREVDIEAVEVFSAPQVWLPAWLFLPRGRNRDKPVVLALEPGGRNRQWSEGQLYQSLAVRGYPVCVADVRGIGDLTPQFGRGAPGHAESHESEEDYAWAGLILGRPMVGQRVTDILALTAGLRKHPALSARRVVVAARGKLTVPALFAAALDQQIGEVYLAGGLVSFRSIVETENYDHTFANFVPSLLRHTDLPDVAATVAPRRVTLAGTVDAAGHAMETGAVRAIYSGGHVTVRDKADWDIEVLSGWSG
jgi:cephalosporin-C deacetylase-like acetyl esterase